MKQTFMALALLLAAPLSICAQFQAGDAFLGGSLGFSQRSSEQMPGIFGGTTDMTASSFEVAPRFGYLLAERFALGLSLGYGYERSFSEGFNDFSGAFEQRDELQALSIQPFLRYYLPLSEGFGFQFDFQTRLTFGKSEAEITRGTPPLVFTSADEVSLLGFSAGLRPGLYYFFGRRFVMELTLGGIAYELLRTKIEGSNDDPSTKQSFSTIFSAQQNVGLQIGFNYFLTRAE